MSKNIFTGEEVDENSPFADILAGVDEISEDERYTAPLESVLEQDVAKQLQDSADRAVSEEGLTLEDMPMVARAFVDGLWFNKSEEVGSAATALALTVLNPELVQGKSFSEVRKEVLASLEADSAEFAEDNPWTALAANVAGGVLNPLSLKGGQVLSQAYKLRKGRQAAQASDEVASTLGGAFASRGDDAAALAAQLGQQQAISQVGNFGKISSVLAQSKAPLVLSAAGFAGAEGALFGYEGDTPEEAVKNAAITGTISTAVPFAFSGIKQGYDLATKSNIAQQLGEGADFVSLMFTEHGLAPAYKYVVSKAYGGFTLMEQQARRIVGKALTPAQAKSTREEFIRIAKDEAAQARKVLSAKSSAKLDAQMLEIDQKIEGLRLLSAESVGPEKAKYDEAIELWELAKVDTGAAKAAAVKDADAAVSAAEASFRGQALREAAPPGASAEEINEIGMLDMQDANAALDDLWKAYGFKAADKYNYELNVNDAVAYINTLAKQFPELALIGGERDIVSAVKTFVKSSIGDGKLSGPELLQVRSDIGRAINSLSDQAPSARRFASEVQDYFHEILESKMSKADKEAFGADRAAWSIRSLVDDAVGGASGRGAKFGAFTAEDWLESVKRFSTRFAGRGQGRLQREAQEVYLASRLNEKNILDLAEENAKQIVSDAAGRVKSSRQNLAAAKERAKREFAKEKAKLARVRAAAKAGSAERLRAEERLLELQSRHRQQMMGFDEAADRARAETEAIKGLMPDNFNASVFERIFNTVLAGQVPALVAPKLGESIGATLLSGGIFSNILARPGTQSFLAGQTGWQRTMQKLGERAEPTLREGALRTTGGGAALASVGVSGQGRMFSDEEIKSLRALPDRAKGGAYLSLKRSGRLDRLKAESPEAYRDLKRAADG